MENEDFIDDLPNNIGELKDIIWIQREELLALRKKQQVKTNPPYKISISFNKNKKKSWHLKLYSLEYEKIVRDPRFSEAIDNQELSTLYEWMWEILQHDNAHAAKLLHNNEHSKAKEEE